MATDAQGNHEQLISELSQLADGRKKLSELKTEYSAEMAEQLAENPGLAPRSNTIGGVPEDGRERGEPSTDESDIERLRSAIVDIKSGQRAIATLLPVDDDAEHIRAAVGYLNFALDSIKQYLENSEAAESAGSAQPGSGSRRQADELTHALVVVKPIDLQVGDEIVGMQRLGDGDDVSPRHQAIVKVGVAKHPVTGGECIQLHRRPDDPADYQLNLWNGTEYFDWTLFHIRRASS
ncbi:hypothetical protein [Mycobacteroides franklinii]|uniref:Uncharacterized protein n=1 Tax=Mycobacteroides franklinii TaxID=948102 RepID=A0A4R5P4L6_9MYCO|nr:hypothetical protein [Mycobacteroides franklinii]ORA60933.1 hypothetical protein BST24_12220 [Mycobacteroides franklinii]TDH17946.1 hypothetical protein EJ571_24765 [Mycobacteroides franklinii]